MVKNKIENQKQTIRIIVCILIIILIALLSVIEIYRVNNRKNQNTIEENTNNDFNTSTTNAIDDSEKATGEEEEDETIFSKEPFKVTNGAYFYTVENCIREYIESIKNLQKEDSEKNRENIYDKLSKDYIEKNKITVDNVNGITIKDDCYLVGAVEMYQLNIIKNYVMRYSARTLFLDNSNKTYYFNFIVYLDYANLTFAIEPISENNTELSKIDLRSEIEDIDANDYNQYKYNVMTKSDIMSKYIKFFKTLCYNVPDIAYTYLSDEYKLKNYPNVESFKNFIINNQDKIKYLQVMSCDDITRQVDNTRYICSNIGGGYITIYEKSIMNFNIELNI